MKDINLFKTTDSIFLKKVKSKTEVLKNEDCDGFLIESSEKEARRIIESLRGTGKIIAIVGESDAFNRRAIETLKIDYLISPEKGDKKNTLKQRDSGLNHVLAKEAARKNISIVVDMGEVCKLGGREKALRLERVIQNIKICRKANCKIKIANLSTDKKNIKDEKGRISFGVSLGMSSVQSSKAVKF
jgi:ribonuclease P/MRP protein subunit RPP1